MTRNVLWTVRVICNELTGRSDETPPSLVRNVVHASGQAQELLADYRHNSTALSQA
jgi:hypothetical protein